MTDEVDKKDPFAAARAAKAAKREAERIAAEAAAQNPQSVAGDTTPALVPNADEPTLKVEAKVEAKAVAEKSETVRLLSGPSYEDRSVWFQALLSAMRNREVKAAPDVKACVAVADEALSVYKDKFK